MTTIKARAINFMLRNRHVLKGKFRKERYDSNTSIQGFRDQCEQGASRYAKIPEGINIIPEIIDGIKCEWIVPPAADTAKVIMYVHGGGYVAGSCADHRAFVSKFAKRSGYVNLVYEYRLAPEHVYPAAVDDSLSLYKNLVDMGFSAQNIMLAGESAGGGLLLATLLAIKDTDLPMPKAAVAISPWTDLTCSSESYITKNRLSLAPLDSWFVFRDHYTGVSEPSLPLISPLFGDLKGLPPVFINSGMDDELYEDGERFYVKAKEAGVDVTFVAGENMVHCYPLFSPIFKEATLAMDQICSFIDKHMGVSSS